LPGFFLESIAIRKAKGEHLTDDVPETCPINVFLPHVTAPLLRYSLQTSTEVSQHTVTPIVPLRFA
jgi:hypothetical protein